MDNVRIRHIGRGQLHLPPVQHKGEEHQVTMGSIDDANNLDVEVPKPEQILDGELWAQLKKLKPVIHWLEIGTLIEYKA